MRRKLIGISCLLALAAAATAAYAEDAAPAISSIGFHDHGSPARGGTYERGERVLVEVRFDRAVKATGSPRLALTIGTHTRYATHSGPGGSSPGSFDSLYFDYVVQAGDRDEDGISFAANALSLGGGTIRSADGTTDADLTHDAVPSWGGHKVNGDLASPPVVIGISLWSPAKGDTYELGETINVRVDFHRAVTVTGSPQLALTIGTQTRHAAYTRSWWGGSVLLFSYAVQEGDRDEDGIAIRNNALSLNGGTIKSADGAADAVLRHAAQSRRFSGKVDGSRITVPAVEGISFVSSPAAGDTYGLGETVEVKVEFDGAIKTTGNPQVALTVGTRTRYATYNGWGPASLYFNYTVQPGDRDEDGISIAANALELSGATITATDGTTSADLTHPEVGADDGGKVDSSLVTPPRVTAVSLISAPARGDTYELGEEVEVQVEFDRAVTVTGDPRLALTIGSETPYAAYFSAWHGDRYLLFMYAVQVGDRDEDGISIAANALVVDGGSITATDGTTGADLTHAAVTPVAGGKVNGSREVTPPRVTNIAVISSPERGDTYQLGETVEVMVEFDGAVKATGDPRLALIIGTRKRHATFSGWGSDALYFSYTVQAGDSDEDGFGIPANALVLGGGTITAADGVTEAVLTHEAMAPAGVGKVSSSDAAPPRVREVRFAYSPARGATYELGETVEVEVEFDRAVEATGEPQVALTIGTQTRYASFSGWGGETLYFEYAVQPGDRDEDGIGIDANALVLNGGTITAVDGVTAADLTHDSLASGREVDGSLVTPPGVSDIYFVSSPARGGTYELGEAIEVLVEFDRAVTVTGTPLVELTIGAQTRHAAFSEWWGQNQYAHFSYTVQEDDRDERGIRIAANAVVLNGATITAADGITDADLTHPAVAGAPIFKVRGSLVSAPAVSAIYLDNHVPPPTGDTYVIGETIRVWVEFDKEITVSGSPQVALTIGSETSQANYTGFSVAVTPDGGTIVDKDVLSFDYRVQATDRDEDGIGIPANALALNGGTIKHAGNGTTDADLTHDAVPADPTRKVDGSRTE
ncbi:MAG: hypothetical protein OXP28_11580 [Gammaproteobacteria bacterium]|nr:hypothetical protein [Gammaproteobacteria bacterium]